MELNHLKYFFAVAREGSFTRASAALRIQQPTISKMVRNLETELGLVLLERYKKGIRLTKSGGEIYRACEDIFNKVEEIRSRSTRGKNELHGRLAFGVPSSVSSYLIPPVLSEFLRHNPKVQPSIFTGTSNLICNEIFDGKLEFGIFFAGPEQAEFQVTEIARVKFVLVVATAQGKRPEIRQSFIISQAIEYPKTTPFPVLDMLKRQKIPVRAAISSNNLDSQKELVKQGLGVALLPAFMVRGEVQKGLLTILYPRKEFSYSLKLVTRKGKVLSRDAAAFLDSFKTALATLV